MKRWWMVALCLAGAVPVLGVQDWPSYRMYLRGLLEEADGSAATAAEMYESVLSRDPEAARVARSLAEVLLASGRLAKGVEAAERYVRLRPDVADSHIILGRAYMAQGKLNKAQASFDQALRLEPSNVEALGWATDQRHRSDPAAARRAYELFLRENADNPMADRVRGRLAELQEKQGSRPTAEAEWKHILETDPRNLDAQMGLATLYDVKGDTAAAIAAYEAYLDISPDHPEVQARLGQLLYEVGEYGRAAQALDGALKAAPKDVGLLFWRALAAEGLDDWRGAAQRMSKVAKKNPQAGVFLRWAAYEQRLGHDGRAISILRKLCRAHPDNADFAYYLAQAYEDDEAWAKAAAAYADVVKKDPQYAEAYFRLAVIADKRGDFTQTVVQLRKTIEVDPGHHVAMNYLGYSWADKNQNLDEALALIQRALALDPENAAYRDSLGWVLFRMGRLEESETALGGAVHRASDDVVWQHYGDVLNALGKRREAFKAWQEGRLINPENKDLVTRLGAEGALRRVEPGTAARTLLKRVEGNFKQLGSAAAFLDLEARWLGRGFSGNGSFYYAKAGLFRLEILGPLFAPQAVVVRNAAGTQWYPAGLGQSAKDADAWFALLGEALSGEYFRQFDSTAVGVHFEGPRLVYEGPVGVIKIDGKTKTLVELRPSASGLRIFLENYQDQDGLLFPTVMRVEMDGGRFRLTLTKLAINPPVDASLFSPSSP